MVVLGGTNKYDYLNLFPPVTLLLLHTNLVPVVVLLHNIIQVHPSSNTVTCDHLARGIPTMTDPFRVSKARKALGLAVRYSWANQKADGHWNGELRANVTLTAEQVFLYQSLRNAGASTNDTKNSIPDSEAYQRYLLNEQQADGSWSIAPQHPGDVSTSVEAYLALRILGLPANAPQLHKARRFILQSGGVAKVRVFTRIFLAQFGLFPWDATPQLPAELILLPAWMPINVYRLASWARSTIVPLLLIAHHRPVYELPNGRSRNNDFIDELWLDPTSKMVPLGPSLLNPFGTDWFSYLFTAIDRGLWCLNGLRSVAFLRTHARKKCVEWILERQEKAGDWAGIIPPSKSSPSDVPYRYSADPTGLKCMPASRPSCWKGYR